MPRFKIPDITIERLSIYLRALSKFTDDTILSSQGLARLVGTTAAQVRKDLAYFGEFGIPGQGYRVGKLREEITHILALDRSWRLVLVGVGKLGAALLAYPGFRRKEFQIVAVFDNDPKKIGRKIEGKVVQDVEIMERVLPEMEVKIGIITTPAEAAQDVADRLVRGGVKGILNFAPVRIMVPDEIKLKNVDLSMELEILSYFISYQKRREMKYEKSER
ncbi:MAG TPA: redox-sensing transcriptional repressor Rex [Candidatus Aerophobetes bacterium]|uniref:Redox-sensing transcriptional repressor Rex n=1 Tax=Aerophobetes bacterium TaxID=2030807 RepID=A0A7V5HYV6_UNCAE|nr:redox-sensing transcriptional repressor Rex [Candidatus Aerophobetes bacterium]